MQLDNHNLLHKTVLELMEIYDIDCYISFTSDPHGNEYIGSQDMRVAMLTGFTGSNGIALTTKDPLLITDGRYYLQAQKESSYKLIKDNLNSVIKRYKKISFDFKMISRTNFCKLSKSAEENGVLIISIDDNLVDKAIKNIQALQNEQDTITLDNKLLKKSVVYNLQRKIGNIIYLENILLNEYLQDITAITHLHSFGFDCFTENVTGSHYLDKINRIRSNIGNKILIISEMDTIAWVLNIRGCDIDFNPVFYSYLIILPNETILFADNEIYLKNITIRKYSDFEIYLSNIPSNIQILISGTCSQFIAQLLLTKNIQFDFTTTVRMMQGQKNKTELAGMVLAYFYDGIALTNLFGYLSTQFKNNPQIQLTEIDIANKLLEFKKQCTGFVQPSFETISATGSNSAIIHHSASNTIVDPTNIYLIDSGSQYFFGTTDTTRTCHFGSPTSEMIHINTLVFKSHIAPMLRQYNINESFKCIDEEGRKPLKKDNKTFCHGLSHGVGHFLNVHENPPIISSAIDFPIDANFVFSIEPGYYKDGEYGVRIENLVYTKLNEKNNAIEIINYTMVPYDLNLLDISLLTHKEKTYLNEFNKKCFNLLKNYVTEEGLEYLKANTKEIPI